MDNVDTPVMEHAEIARGRLPAIVLSFCALAVVALVLLATATIARQPVMACVMLLTCIPLASILSYGHVLGIALTRDAARRDRVTRMLEALMQTLSVTPYAMLVLPPFA